MVSTRSQTQDPPQRSPEQELTPTRAKVSRVQEQDLTPSESKATRQRKGPWAHTPSNISILWLAVSLPLVAWDTGYVMLRPHSMPGGSLHWPIWAPYELYGRVDYIYGWKAFNEKNGFTAAQSLLNIVETSMYLYYLYILFTYGRSSNAQGRGAPKTSDVGVLGQQRYVDGQMGAVAVLVGFSAAIMTLSKTVLYWASEYYSGFDNVGHNSFTDLLFLWIIPNGLWLILPSYIVYLTGAEIVQGLTIAAGGATGVFDDTSIDKTE